MTASLLSLPTEVRLVIYKHCMTPSIPSEGGAELERYEVVQPDRLSTSNIHLKHAHHSMPPGYPAQYTKSTRNPIFVKPRCQVPHLHLTLLPICRQIHQEYWPIYASMHCWHFTDPLKFANEFLSRLPLQRLSDIRHLRISFSRQPLRTDADVTCWGTDVRHNMRNLSRVWKLYPELQRNLETLEIECNPHYSSHTLREENKHIDVLIKILIEMFESNEQSSSISNEGHDDSFFPEPELVDSHSDGGVNPRNTRSFDLRTEQEHTDKLLVWCSAPKHEPGNRIASTPLSIQIKPISRKIWDRLPKYSSPSRLIQTERPSDLHPPHVNSLMPLVLKENFLKFGPVQNAFDDDIVFTRAPKQHFWQLGVTSGDDSNLNLEQENPAIDKTWKVMFSYPNEIFARTWHKAVTAGLLEKRKKLTAELNRTSKTKRKAEQTADRVDVLIDATSAPKNTKRRKRKN